MNRNKLAALIAGTALAALAVGCSTTDNANTANVNSNTAVVVNSNTVNTNANTAANTNANTGSRASYNANMTRADYDKDKARYEQEAKSSGSKIGTGANDGWLWTKVRASLLTADDLRDSTIDVDVDNGKVTLNGTVADGNQKVKAVSIAQKVEGVKGVTNNLKIKADGDANKNANAAKK